MPHNGDSIQLTQQAHQALQSKRDELHRQLTDEQRELYGLAREEKDPTGNHPHMAAQESIARLDGQIYELDQMLSNAVIVEDDTASDCMKVTIGKRVVLHMHECDCPEPNRLEVIVDGVCSSCGGDTRVVTPDSPVGAAIIGAKAGDERQFVTPHGKVIQIVIVSISSY